MALATEPAYSGWWFAAGDGRSAIVAGRHRCRGGRQRQRAMPTGLAAAPALESQL